MVGHAPSFLIGALLLELDMPPRLLGFASSPRSPPPLLVCRALLSCERRLWFSHERIRGVLWSMRVLWSGKSSASVTVPPPFSSPVVRCVLCLASDPPPSPSNEPPPNQTHPPRVPCRRLLVRGACTSGGSVRRTRRGGHPVCVPLRGCAWMRVACAMGRGGGTDHNDGGVRPHRIGRLNITHTTGRLRRDSLSASPPPRDVNPPPTSVQR